ncbi:MAG TPA: alpha/beta hydrolase [Kofleriaceae bacterium]
MLHVERVGTGDPVVLLHSSGLSSTQWKRLVPKLTERGLQAVLVDLTGQGKAPPLPEGTPFDWHEDVELVKQLAPKYIIGHSYGGLVGLHVALAQPVEKIMLYDPVAFGILDPIEDADALATLAMIDLQGGAAPADRDAWLKGFVDYWSGTGAWDALREPARSEFRRVSWAVREGVISLMRDHTRQYPRMPLTLLTGSHTPVAARRVVERLAYQTGANVHHIAGAGHMGPLSHADEVNDFLRNIS